MTAPVSAQADAHGKPPASDAATSMTAIQPPAVAALPTAALVVLGAAITWTLGDAAASGRGAARALSPDVLLATFDAAWLLLLLPGAGLLWRVVLLVTGLPFHATIAAAAGAGPGHAVALTLLLVAFALATAVPRTSAAGAASGRRPLLPLSVITFVLPLWAYASMEFLGSEGTQLLLASPLTAPVLLARQAASATTAMAIPGVVAAALLLVVDMIVARLLRGRAGEDHERDEPAGVEEGAR